MGEPIRDDYIYNINRISQVVNTPRLIIIRHYAARLISPTTYHIIDICYIQLGLSIGATLIFGFEKAYSWVRMQSSIKNLLPRLHLLYIIHVVLFIVLSLYYVKFHGIEITFIRLIQLRDG